MASPARLSERRTDKKTHNIFLSLSLAPSRCLSFLSVRRAPTDQRGWAESWTTCWQDLLNSPQWHIVKEKEGEAEAPVHSYLSLIYWVRALIKSFLPCCYFLCVKIEQSISEASHLFFIAQSWSRGSRHGMELGLNLAGAVWLSSMCSSVCFCLITESNNAKKSRREREREENKADFFYWILEY